MARALQSRSVKAGHTMHHRLNSQLAASWIASHGCAEVASTESVPTKHDVVAGKADGIGWCSSLGADPGCDVCAEMGWYGDGSCGTSSSGPYGFRCGSGYP